MGGPAEARTQNVGEPGWTVDAAGISKKGIGIDLHVKMTRLTDWLDEPMLRTFSGRATHLTHVSISAVDLKGVNRILLDSGELKDAADVKINGVAAATLVVHPFVTDIRGLLQEGDNEVQVTVVNSLTNYGSTIQWPKNPASQMGRFPPISAGLLGPVVPKFEINAAKR